MTDEIQESNPELGSAGSPNPSASQTLGDKPTSAFDADQLLKLVEPLIEKKVQSVKDRRFDEFDKRLGGTELVLERVKGLIPDKEFKELTKELEFEELKRRVYGQQTQTSTPATGKPQEVAAVDVAKVVSDIGLDPTDVDAIAIAARTYPNEEARELALRRHAMGRKSPTSADQSAPPGAPPKKAELTEEGYLKEMRAAPRGSKGDAERAAVQKKYKEGGVNVYGVDFT